MQQCAPQDVWQPESCFTGRLAHRQTTSQSSRTLQNFAGRHVRITKLGLLCGSVHGANRLLTRPPPVRQLARSSPDPCTLQAPRQQSKREPSVQLVRIVFVLLGRSPRTV